MIGPTRNAPRSAKWWAEYGKRPRAGAVPYKTIPYTPSGYGGPLYMESEVEPIPDPAADLWFVMEQEVLKQYASTYVITEQVWQEIIDGALEASRHDFLSDTLSVTPKPPLTPPGPFQREWGTDVYGRLGSAWREL